MLGWLLLKAFLVLFILKKIFKMDEFKLDRQWVSTQENNRRFVESVITENGALKNNTLENNVFLIFSPDAKLPDISAHTSNA